MNRYSRITNKNCREIVLLKAYPCAWGKCAFCDYIEDNSRDECYMVALNHDVLSMVTGEFKVLEVINSGSCFEIPQETLEEIRDIIKEKKIERLFFESHWMYRNKLKEMEDFMGIPITYKIGVETFDNDFREIVLRKHGNFKTPEEVATYFQSPCLMVGIKGQTKEMIRRDIELLKQHFKLGTINVYMNNSTPITRDEELVEWFIEEYKYLDMDSSIEVLYNNLDFGVG